MTVVFISGGGAGIGRACAWEFARQGAAVVIGEIEPIAGQTVGDELQAAGHSAFFVPLDATDETSVKAAFEAVERKFGYISVLINNVGHYTEQTFEQMSLEEWNRELQLNLTSVFLGTKYGLPLLERANGSKVIINLSSNLAKIAEPLAPTYCAAKAGVEMLTKCLALEYARRGIRVVAIAPGPVGRSEAELLASPADELEEEFRRFNPLQRFATPEEVARTIVFMASKSASYMTGSILALDGGETANPASWSVLKRVKDEGRV